MHRTFSLADMLLIILSLALHGGAVFLLPHCSRWHSLGLQALAFVAYLFIPGWNAFVTLIFVYFHLFENVINIIAMPSSGYMYSAQNFPVNLAAKT